MTAEIFEFDEAKQAKIKEDRARMHWNLLVDAKKEPVKVREALLASVFDEVIGSLIFIDASMRKGSAISKYQVALIKLIGAQLVPLIPLLDLKKDYEEHLEYMSSLKSIFYEVDKAVFRSFYSLTGECDYAEINLSMLSDKLKGFTSDELKEKRVTVLLGSDLSTELLNSKEFVEIFEPYTDQELLLRGKLGRIKIDDLEVPVLTDGMRKDDDRCLTPDSIFICSEFDANLRVRHNNTWDSLIFDVNGLVTGVNQYAYRVD